MTHVHQQALFHHLGIHFEKMADPLSQENWLTVAIEDAVIGVTVWAHTVSFSVTVDHKCVGFMDYIRPDSVSQTIIYALFPQEGE
jgi:hypothetical protein